MKTRHDFYRAIERNIDRDGQHMFAVFPSRDEGSPAFIYTIGNHEHGLPELLIVGGCDRQMGELLNLVGDLMRKRGRAWADGELVSLGGKLPVKILDAPAEAKQWFTIQAGNYYRTDDYSVAQVVLCDKQGRFPGEAGCAAPYSDQLMWRAN